MEVSWAQSRLVLNGRTNTTPSHNVVNKRSVDNLCTNRYRLADETKLKININSYVCILM